MNKLYILNGLIAILILSSCGGYKKIPYYQDLDYTRQTGETVKNYTPLTIQPADILSISVTSRSPESSAIFGANAAAHPSSSINESQQLGYKVDPQGNIDLPLLQTMKVAGLTTAQLQQKLKENMLTYYKDPVVNVKILNLKVFVYGDVLRPDAYSLPNEKTTITQALALAGDLNITAMRDRIVLVRVVDNERKFIPIDLTSKNLFNSPYYYLNNNDEIYVQPDKPKYATVDGGYRTASLFLSGLSVLAIVVSNLYR
jgi:polysaccharide export outer membrane protein